MAPFGINISHNSWMIIWNVENRPPMKHDPPGHFSTEIYWKITPSLIIAAPVEKWRKSVSIFNRGRGEGSLSNVEIGPHMTWYTLFIMIWKLRVTKGEGEGQLSTLEFDPIYNDLLYASQFNS